MSIVVPQGWAAALPKQVVPPRYGPRFPEAIGTVRRWGCRRQGLFLAIFLVDLCHQRSAGATRLPSRRKKARPSCVESKDGSNEVRPVASSVKRWRRTSTLSHSGACACRGAKRPGGLLGNRGVGGTTLREDQFPNRSRKKRWAGGLAGRRNCDVVFKVLIRVQFILAAMFSSGWTGSQGCRSRKNRSACEAGSIRLLLLPSSVMVKPSWPLGSQCAAVTSGFCCNDQPGVADGQDTRTALS